MSNNSTEYFCKNKIFSRYSDWWDSTWWDSAWQKNKYVMIITILLQFIITLSMGTFSSSYSSFLQGYAWGLDFLYCSSTHSNSFCFLTFAPPSILEDSTFFKLSNWGFYILDYLFTICYVALNHSMTSFLIRKMGEIIELISENFCKG